MSSIAMIGSDIYVAGGYINESTVQTAGYWKNGKWNELHLEATKLRESDSAEVEAMAVSGLDVYIAGFGIVRTLGVAPNIVYPQVIHPDKDGSYTGFGYGFWKNGVWTALNLPDETKGVRMFSISILGSDIYVAGAINIKYTKGL